MTTPTQSIVHGAASYTRHGCRCDECRTAHNEAQRRYGSNRRIGRRGEVKRSWDEAHRKVCACGRLTSSREHDVCLICFNLAKRAKRDARRDEIQARWLEGQSLKEIAAALGTSPGSIGVQLVWMRRDGWDVPRRGPRGKVLA